MALSREVAAARFAQWVRRAIDRARARGMTDPAIEQATGVGKSTFHRWRKGQWGRTWPEIPKVVDFAEGLGEDPAEAFAALGVGLRRLAGAPPVREDIRRALRALADPNVPPEQKRRIEDALLFLDIVTRQTSRKS